MKHYIKCWTEFFDQVIAGNKPWELRVNDRNYCVGDEVVLQDFNNETKTYTGREYESVIDFVLKKSPWLLDGHCIFTLRRAPDAAGATGGARAMKLDIRVRELTKTLSQIFVGSDPIGGFIENAPKEIIEEVAYRLRAFEGREALPVASSQPSAPATAPGRKEFVSRFPTHRFKCEHCDNWQSEHEMGPNGVPLYCPDPQPPDSSPAEGGK